MRSNFFANEFAHIHGLQSETGTPARNALSEHYPTTGLKIPLTAFVLDTSGMGFDNPAEPPALHEHPNFPEFMIFNFRCIFRDLIDPPAGVKKYQFFVDFCNFDRSDRTCGPVSQPPFLTANNSGAKQHRRKRFFDAF